jgi:hypothetical protein
MILTIEGTYRNGAIELGETPAGIDESRVFVTFLPEGAARKPASLYGLWKDMVPEDFDVDAALKEIRSAWLEDMKECEP